MTTEAWDRIAGVGCVVVIVTCLLALAYAAVGGG